MDDTATHDYWTWKGKKEDSKIIRLQVVVQVLPCYFSFKVVLALEGGYDLPAICDSAQECVKALLGEPVTPIPEEELLRTPNPPAVDTLLRTIAIQTPHWPCIKRYVSLATCSAVEAASAASIEGKIFLRERAESEAVSAMASLSMHHARRPSEANSRCSNDSNEGSDVSTSVNISSKRSTRRSSEMNMNEDDGSVTEGGKVGCEEPMDQDDELVK